LFGKGATNVTEAEGQKSKVRLGGREISYRSSGTKRDDLTFRGNTNDARKKGISAIMEGEQRNVRDPRLVKQKEDKRDASYALQRGAKNILEKGREKLHSNRPNKVW